MYTQRRKQVILIYSIYVSYLFLFCLIRDKFWIDFVLISPYMFTLKKC